MGRKKTSQPVMQIDTAFIQVVDAVSTTISKKQLSSPVDIKLEFNQVGINSKKILGFGKSSKKDLTITLATRINPEDLPQ